MNNFLGPEGDTVTVDEQLLNTEYTETSGGETGRNIYPTSWYMTTPWLIFMCICTDIHSSEAVRKQNLLVQILQARE